MWAHVITAALGIWMMAAPAVLDYGGAAATNDRICGPVVATCAVIAWWGATRGMRWINVPIGIWLIAAPWALSYGTGTLIVHSMALGFAIAGFSIVRGRIRKRYGGGWRSLFRSDIATEGPPA